ncbi:cilia- and flagella-associated protein 44-like [Mugil cephalus]|uniref:cilia- and flagella-associated protein 44-like n=1 Tax=Mugil cephalus TaxID=48193 RepID=UPI001FB7040F|nr:cilia- and flagella-associated protein 44-like [Mugil cephalus]
MAEENTGDVSEQTATQEKTAGGKHSKMQDVAEGKSKKQLPADMYYNYEELHSRPSVTPDSKIPENFLNFSHSFGYDSGRRANLQLLDDTTLMFIAGNLLVLLDISTKEQKYLRSCSGQGIGSIAVHYSKRYFAVAEKGNQPNIIVYEYPSLRPYRILRGGAERVYSFVNFNPDGNLLASVCNAHHYMLTLWDWKQEEVMLRYQGISPVVYRVSFSPYNPALLTSSGSRHIKFWEIASTVTGLKLQGSMGMFGLTAATDIESCMELPDGKVVSGTDWGNLLLWEESDIIMEICRKEGRTCHVGTVQPFSLEDGQLLTIGSDGVVRAWDYERINGTASNSDCRMFELDPLNELVVGHNVCLSSMVKSSPSDSFIWFAQDSHGAIWKLDLSFTNTTLDPECLFSFHTGAIKGLDVSKRSHLMATTTLDRSVKVFDFLEKRELTTIHFNQGGTALTWAPLSVNQSGCLLVTGFEDGVIRLVELYNPQKPHLVAELSSNEDAKLRLKQAFKPHNAPVTALAYEQNGEILATGSADCTVFFFTVGETYNPIGFTHVPGPVRALEWSPHSHREKRLLVLCQSGHVVEVHRPDPKAKQPSHTFHLSELPSRSFRFKSIKSQIKREEEIARRQLKKSKQQDAELKEEEEEEQEEEVEEEEEEEEEEELPPIYIPDPPSPLYCGFYSQPGQFWLSMGGFDSGYLYHCKFSDNQDEDPKKRQDEPFGFLPVDNADNDPIHVVTFSSNRQLLLCGMHSGSIRVYPLQPGDHSLTSMQAYWTLSVHDNDYGHLRHIRCSYDNHFVLTAGDDGNIFSFSLLPPEELQKKLQIKRAELPLPKAGIDNDALAQDIEHLAAYSLQTAKQKLHKDHLRQNAELRDQEQRRKLSELQKKYEQALKVNQSLPEHIRLKPEELQLDPQFYEHTERMKAERVMKVKMQLAFEQERYNIAFNKLHNWFKATPEANIVTVVAIHTSHRVSTYHLPVFTNHSPQMSKPSSPDGEREATPKHTKSRAEPAKDTSDTEEDEVLHPPEVRPKIKLGDWQEERLRKAAKKADQARARIEKKKQEWADLYAEKPDKDCEDPEDVQAICEAKENTGDIKLKSDVSASVNLRIIAEKKREDLNALEENVSKKKVEMNERILALRDSKIRLVSWLRAQTQQLQKVQQRLAIHLRLIPPDLPSVLPEETPEKWLQYKLTALERYRVLREKRCNAAEHEKREDVCWSSCEVASLLEQIKKEMECEEKRKEQEENREEEKTVSLSPPSSTVEEETEEGEEAERDELEEELLREEEIRLLYEQDSLLKKMENSMRQFDMDLVLLHQQKMHLDSKLKLADLHQLTLLEEMLLLRQFNRREGSLQEKLTGYIKKEKSIRSTLEESKEEIELNKLEIVKLQEKEKTLFTTFQAALGENNKFEEFLTRVFKKKIKRVKKKEQVENEGQESDEDSDEDDWDEDDCEDFSNTQDGAALDDSVCPSGCDPELFEYALKLRERRLDLEELLVKEKKTAEVLKIERDSLIKKEKTLKSCRKGVVDDLEMVNREIQQKMNQLDVVVPLRLHQIQLVDNDSVLSDLSEMLVLDRTQLNKLQDRIKELQMENKRQRELCHQTQQQRTNLISGLKVMTSEIQVLEERCNELMRTKFGKLVDLDALQVQAGNRRMEELKQEQLLKEAAHAKEIKQWDAKVDEARSSLIEVTTHNTELLHRLTNLLKEKSDMERKLLIRQRKMGKLQYQDYSRRENQEDIQRLKEMVKTQSEQEKTLRREIDLLTRKGSHVAPSSQVHLPLITPPATSTGHINSDKQEVKLKDKTHNSPSKKGVN